MAGEEKEEGGATIERMLERFDEGRRRIVATYRWAWTNGAISTAAFNFTIS